MRRSILIISLSLLVTIPGLTQTIYLHSDKYTYETGETIWFRVYLLDRDTQLPAPGIQNIYVELLNTIEQIVWSGILLSKDGLSNGQMMIHESMPEGNYVIRAYTSWMLEYGKEQIFESHIYIVNPGYEDQISRREIRFNRRFNRKLARLRENGLAGQEEKEEMDKTLAIPDLSFFPEISAISPEGNDYISLRILVEDESGTPAPGAFSFSAVSSHDKHHDRETFVLHISQYSDMSETASHPPYPDTGGFEGLSVIGQLVNPASNEVVRDHPVTLKIMTEEDSIFHSRTDQYGSFRFGGLIFTGRVNAEIASRPLSAGYPPKYILDVRKNPEFRYTPGIYTRMHRITARGKHWQRVPRNIPQADKPQTRSQVWPQRYGVPDQTIYIDQDRTPVRLRDVLNRELYAVGGQIVLHEALYYVDNINVSADHFMNLLSRDFERIEIFKGARASVFDRGSSSGVILAWSRLPGYMGHEEVLKFEMEGYHTARTFVAGPGNNIAPVTIYWEPALRSGTDGMLYINFPYNPSTGDLNISIDGIGLNGNPGSARFKITSSDL